MSCIICQATILVFYLLGQPLSNETCILKLLYLKEEEMPENRCQFLQMLTIPGFYKIHFYFLCNEGHMQGKMTFMYIVAPACQFMALACRKFQLTNKQH